MGVLLVAWQPRAGPVVEGHRHRGHLSGIPFDFIHRLVYSVKITTYVMKVIEYECSLIAKREGK